MDQQKLIEQIVNEHLTQYVKRTGNRPTQQVIDNVFQFVLNDARKALESGMSYEDYYIKAFKEFANSGNMTTEGKASGQAYELMGSQGLRSKAAGMLTGQGRGQINPPNVNPNIYPDVGGGQGRTGTAGSYYSDPRQWDAKLGEVFYTRPQYYRSE